MESVSTLHLIKSQPRLININDLCQALAKWTKIDAHYDDLNVLMAQHSFGRHVLPVAMVMSPEERYRARVAKQENVDALEKSLLSFGSVNEHVEVVLFVSRGKTLPSPPLRPLTNRRGRLQLVRGADADVPGPRVCRVSA